MIFIIDLHLLRQGCGSLSALSASVIVIPCCLFGCSFFSQSDLQVLLASPCYKHVTRLSKRGRGKCRDAAAKAKAESQKKKRWTFWLWSPDFDGSEPDFGIESEYLSLSLSLSTTDHLSWSHHSLHALEWEVLTLFAHMMVRLCRKVTWCLSQLLWLVKLRWLHCHCHCCGHYLSLSVNTHLLKIHHQFHYCCLSCLYFRCAPLHWQWNEWDGWHETWWRWWWWTGWRFWMMLMMTMMRMLGWCC